MIADVAHPVRWANTTSYCQAGRMADGSRTRPGSVAMNSLPLHTRIRGPVVIAVVAGVAIGTLIAWGGLFWLAGALDVWLCPDWEREQGLVPYGKGNER